MALEGWSVQSVTALEPSMAEGAQTVVTEAEFYTITVYRYRYCICH